MNRRFNYTESAKEFFLSPIHFHKRAIRFIKIKRACFQEAAEMY